VLELFATGKKTGEQYYESLKGEKNIVQVTAHGPYRSGAKRGNVLVELPKTTLRAELAAIFRDGSQSPLYNKQVIQNIIKGIVGGLEQTHKKKILHASLIPQNVFLYGEPGPAQFTAKLAHFSDSHDDGKVSMSFDVDSLREVLQRIIGTLYYRAKKRLATETPCAGPTSKSSEVDWQASVCEITKNMHRITWGF